MVQYERPPEPNEELRQNIPDSWYYNANGAQRVWQDLEAGTDVKKAEECRKEEDNPFMKIDQSAHKIRQMIDAFELTDQEFLMSLMGMLDEDSSVDNLDHQSILMEARYRLAEMIQEHVNRSDAQGKMLDSLKYWFSVVRKESQQELEHEVPRLSDNDTIDATQLASMINQVCERNEIVSDQATHLHHSITDELHRQIREAERQIKVRDVEIERLRKQADSQQRTRRRAQTIAKKVSVKDPVAALNQAQRKIVEQDGQIVNLKQALTGKEEDEGSMKMSSTDVGALCSTVNVLPPEKELEYETRMHFLTEQVNGLKGECVTYQLQLKTAKLTEIELNNKLGSLERLKRNYEETVATLNQKFDLMEASYKKKLEAALEDRPKESDSTVVANLRAEYENRIIEIKELARKQQQGSMEQLEKRHRAQVADLLKSLESGDQSSVVQTLIKQNETKAQDNTVMQKKQIEELKKVHTEKLMSTTKLYESKLKLATANLEKMRSTFEDDLAAKLMEQKIELENEFRKQMARVQDEADQKASDMKVRLVQKIDTISNLNKRLTNERDALRQIVDETEAARIPVAEDEANEQEALEEEAATEALDDFAIEEKISAARKEAEDKYNALMNSQQEMLTNAKEWELEKQREDLQARFDQQLNEMREKMMTDLAALRGKIGEEGQADDVDKMLSELASSMERHEEMKEEIGNSETMVPLSQVQKELDEMRHKVMEATSENDFMRRSLEKMSRNSDLVNKDGGVDMVKAMRESVAEEAIRINDVLKENEKLRAKIDELQKEIEKLRSMGPDVRVVDNVIDRMVLDQDGEPIEGVHQATSHPTITQQPQAATSSSNTNQAFTHPTTTVETHNEEDRVVVRDLPVSMPTVPGSVPAALEPETFEARIEDTSATPGKTEDVTPHISETQARAPVQEQVVRAREVAPPVSSVAAGDNPVREFRGKVSVALSDPHERVEIPSPRKFDTEAQTEIGDTIRVVKVPSRSRQANGQVVEQGAAQARQVVCGNCGHEIVVDEKVWQSSNGAPQVVECEKCHSPASLGKPDDAHEDAQMPQSGLDPEQMQRICQLEAELKNQISGLVEMKKGMSTQPVQSEDDKAIHEDDGEPKQAEEVSGAGDLATEQPNDGLTEEQQAQVKQQEEEISAKKAELEELKAAMEKPREQDRPGISGLDRLAELRMDDDDIPSRRKRTQSSEVFTLQPVLSPQDPTEIASKIHEYEEQIRKLKIELERREKGSGRSVGSAETAMRKNRVSFQLGVVKPTREQRMRMMQQKEMAQEASDMSTIRLGSGQYKTAKSLGNGIEPGDQFMRPQRFGTSLDGSKSPFDHGDRPPLGGASLDGSPSPFSGPLATEEMPAGDSSQQKAEQDKDVVAPARDDAPSSVDDRQDRQRTEKQLTESREPFGQSLDGSPSPFAKPPMGQSLDGSASPFSQQPMGQSLDGSVSPFGKPPMGQSLDGSPSPFANPSMGQSLDGSPSPFAKPPMGQSLDGSASPFSQQPMGQSLDGSASPFGKPSMGQSLDGSPSPFGRPPMGQSLDGSASPFSQPAIGKSLDDSPSPFSQQTQQSGQSMGDSVGIPISQLPKQARNITLGQMTHGNRMPTSASEQSLHSKAFEGLGSPRRRVDLSVARQDDIDIPIFFQNIPVENEKPLVILRPSPYSVICHMAPVPVITTAIEPAQPVLPSGGTAMERLQMQMKRQSTLGNMDEMRPISTKTFITPEADMRSLQISETRSFTQIASGQGSERLLKRVTSQDSTPEVAMFCPDSQGMENTTSSALIELNPRSEAVILGEPKDVAQYMAELEEFREKMATLRENNTLLKAMYDEIATSTRDLQKRHGEIVTTLTTALDSAMKLARGDGEHPESLIEKMQEQTAFLTNVVREKESLHTTADQAHRLLAERSHELIAIQEDLSARNSKIDLLSDKLSTVTTALEDSKQQLSNLETIKDEYEKTEEERKTQIDFLQKKLSNSEETKLHLQGRCDNLSVELEQVKNELALAQVVPTHDMAQLSPFIIFSTDAAPIMPQRGFALEPGDEQVPSSRKPSSPRPEPLEPLEPLPIESEKIIVKSGTSSVRSLKKPLEPLRVVSGRSTEGDDFETMKPVVSDKNLVYITPLNVPAPKVGIAPMSLKTTSRNTTSRKSATDTASTMSSAVPEGPFFKVNQITGKTIENQTLINLKKRLQAVEASLQNKTKEMIANREELHELQQSLFKANSLATQYERDLQASLAQSAASKQKLDASVTLIAQLSTENERLRKLIKELSEVTQQATKHAKIARYMKEDSDLAAISEMKNRALMHDFQQYGESEEARKLAARHALAIAKWEGRRQFLLQQERQHTLQVLNAMKLISGDARENTPTDPVNRNEKVPTPQLTPGFKITTMSLGQNAEAPPVRHEAPAPSPLAFGESPSLPSFEDALKNANAHRQKIPKKLRYGVVANPIKV